MKKGAQPHKRNGEHDKEDHVVALVEAMPAPWTFTFAWVEGQTGWSQQTTKTILGHLVLEGRLNIQKFVGQPSRYTLP